MNQTITDTDLSLVREMIVSRFGLHFPATGWSILRHRLSSAAAELGFQEIHEFIQLLLSSELSKDQIKVLASNLTVPETYFWREKAIFKALTDSILPELIKKKISEEKSIRIWSAGCASGEEPYSIAIALLETIPKISNWDISILATDINPKALALAETGIYCPWSFRNSPDWLRNRYFSQPDDQKYEIIPEIRKMVTFSVFNLTGNDFLSTICENHKIDIIFCRNVLMYFTKEWMTKVSMNLYNSLSDEGWLIVSSCELSSQLFSQFATVSFPDAFLYRKGKNGSAHSLSMEAISKVDFNSSTFQTLQPSSSKALAKEDLQHLSGIALSDTQRSFSDSAIEERLQEPESIDDTHEKLISDKVFAIRLLANKGYLSESLSLCDEVIALEKLSPGLYFLRASILQELDKISEAIISLRKAIYINPDYVMGHFTLGNLFIMQGKSENAKRYFKNVLNLLGRFSNDDILPESEGLSVKYIRELVLVNMQTRQIS